MDEFVRQLLTSVVVIAGWLIYIVGALVNFPQFAEQYLPPRMRKHPQILWFTTCTLAMAISVHFIWNRPGSLPLANIAPPHKAVVAAESPAKPDAETTLPETPPVVNQQAQKMARQYEDMLKKVSGRRLEDYERKFYSEYLCCVMPARIESACGSEERQQYERLLDGLKNGSDDIQLHFHGLEPFVTKDRYITPHTPSAGPLIENRPISEMAARDDSKSTIAAKPPLPSDSADPDIPDFSALEKPKSTEIKTTTEKSPPAKSKVEDQHATEKPPSVVQAKTPLEEYLDRVGWVQCRKCGKVHYMTFGVFARSETRHCEQCDYDMHFHKFSREIAAEAKRIESSADAK